jgi:hypothetical protein
MDRGFGGHPIFGNFKKQIRDWRYRRRTDFDQASCELFAKDFAPLPAFDKVTSFAFERSRRRRDIFQLPEKVRRVTVDNGYEPADRRFGIFDHSHRAFIRFARCPQSRRKSGADIRTQFNVLAYTFFDEAAEIVIFQTRAVFLNQATELIEDEIVGMNAVVKGVDGVSVFL